LVPPSFVQIGDKDFGTVVGEKLVNYGSQWQGIDLSDAQDPYYNPEKAKAKFAEAKQALQAKGVEFPIHLDMPVDQSSTIGVQWASSTKQSIESALGAENVVIDLQKMTILITSPILLTLLLRKTMICLLVVGLVTTKTHLPILILSISRTAEACKTLVLSQVRIMIR